ncbi:MAG: hypothetical protein OEZ13_04665 [Spirochaetia bacterium]|nr:hypothetical protein [Spirochaetia bacterium]
MTTRRDKIFNLEKLLPAMQNGRYCIIGAGPSLDFCEKEITELAEKETTFLLSDSVASSFIKIYPNTKRIIFTVEARYHLYLKTLKKESIAFYIHANKRNLSEEETAIYLFQFVYDLKKSDLKTTVLVSPGTVAGAMLSWALYSAKNLKFKSTPEIYLLGVDLAYADNMIYSRLFSAKYEAFNLFFNRETHEYIASLKKSSYAYLINGFPVRTSDEFYKTKKNIEKLIDTINFPLRIYDYSPLGIVSAKVEKRAPKALNV